MPVEGRKSIHQLHEHEFCDGPYLALRRAGLDDAGLLALDNDPTVADAAVAAIKRKIAANLKYDEAKPCDPRAKKPNLAAYPLSRLVVNQLRRYSVTTINELADCTALRLQEIKGIGGVAMGNIRKVLSANGLSLADE